MQTSMKVCVCVGGWVGEWVGGMVCDAYPLLLLLSLTLRVGGP